MKVTLKNVKINLEFSEETTMFKADLFIDDVKVGYCSNDGRGGNTNYQAYESEDWKVIKACDEYYKSLPKKSHTFEDGRVFEFERSLESEIDTIIDEMANEKEKEKFKRKMEKDMKTKLVLQNGNPNTYETVGWRDKTIAEILDNPLWRSSLIETVKKYKKQGYRILNDNIPIEILGTV